MNKSRNKTFAIVVLAGLCAGPVSRGADAYALGAESTLRAAGVPAGRVETFRFTESRVFPGTERDGWVYLPAQYDGTKPAALMVFQDGHAYVSTNGQMRVPIVFDNLIAKGEMPVTLAVFVNPGHIGTNGPAATGWGNRSNRSVEYDSLGDAYPRFLIEELLPFVARKFDVRITEDPRLRAVCGMSSGGICAWTVAWERPESFGKVLSHIGSFTNIRGGHAYQALLRKSERRAIRVFLQDGSNDLNNEHGSWPLANREMAASLAFKGYDFKFEFGDGAHNGKHGGAILPDSLRWLWAPEMKTADAGAGASASAGLPPGAGESAWELVGEGYAFTDAACSDTEGRFYFSDLPKGTVYRTGVDGLRPEPWLANGPKVSGMKFGPDGKLYACVQGEGTNNVKRVVVIDPATRAVEVLATDVQPNDLAVAGNGFLYFTDTGAGQVVRVPLSARGLSRPPPVAGGINKPNGIALSPDGSRLWVSEYGGTREWCLNLAAEGSVSGAERLAVIREPAGKPDSGGDGSTVDRAGRVYVTSHLGIQVFDSSGRPVGTLPRPQEKGTVSCVFAGPGGTYLYVCSSDRVYRRKL
jgi:enterochelin esterase family protein